MKSIGQRIVVSMILATLTAGGLIYIQNRTRANTYDYLTESARVYGNEMNTVIVGIEATVDSLSRSLEGVLECWQ